MHAPVIVYVKHWSQAVYLNDGLCALCAIVNMFYIFLHVITILIYVFVGSLPQYEEPDQ